MPKIIIEIGKGQNADQILASLKAQLGGVSDSVSLLGENTRRLEREQRQAERSFRATAAALDPTIAKAQEYEKAQRALSEALKRNIITQQEHDRLLALAKDRHNEVSGSMDGMIGRFSAGTLAIAGFAAAVGASLVVLDQLQQFISASVSAAAESERAQAQINARIASTGGAAELSARQLADMANELQNLSKFDDESLAGAQNVLLTFTSVKGDTFREAMGAITDMSTALGTDLATNARLVGKALEDPVKGLSALSKAGVVFTTGQRDVIQSLVESGDLLGAQDAILAALSERYGGAAAADVVTFGGSIDRLNNLWDNFQEKVGQGVLPVLSTFLEQVGNVVLGNDELAASLGRWVEEGGRALAVLISGAAEAGSSWLGMAASVMGAMASVVEAAANGAEALGKFFHIDNSMLVDGLREAAKGQRENAAVAQALADAAGDVSDAAFLAAIAMGKEGDAAKSGAKHSSDHAAADEEAAKEAEAFAKSLRGLLDDLDPIGKAEREAAEGIEILNRALSEGMPVEKYQNALAALIKKLNDAKVAATGLGGAIQEHAILPLEIDPEGLQRHVREIKPPIEVPATLTISQDGYSEFDRESDAATERFSQNMEAGLVSAGETFLMELMQGGDDAWEHLGENLTQVLLQSVAEWLTAQLAGIAKAALASRAIGGAGGGTPVSGSVMGQGSIVSSGSGLATSGASSMGTFVAVVAVFAAAVAMFKHQTDRANAVRYDTTSGATVNGGLVSNNWTGNLDKSGPMVASAIGGLLQAFQESTGSFIEGLTTAEVAIRNDKTQFRAIVNGIVVGQFNTASEAIIAAAKEAFLGANLSSELNPILRSVISGFKGDKPEDLIQVMQSVQGILDEVSGLTEIEVSLRGLPAQASAFAAKLMSLSVSFDDANRLATDWQVSQLNNLRDQITGHQRSAAEEMAERQRQAVMFNAQVTLLRAETQMKRDELAVRVAALQAAGLVLEADLNLKNTELSYQNDYLSRKVDAFEQEVNVHEWYLNTLGTIGNTSLEILQTMIAALDQQLASIPELITPGQIHLPGGHSGGGGGQISAGPSEAEQRASDFEAFLEQRALVGLSGLQRRLTELDAAYAEQAQAASEVAGGEERLAAARAAELAAMREDLIDGLGLPMEASRDRFRELAEVMAYLQETTDRTAESSARYRQILHEMTDQANRELLGIAADLADTMGMDSDAAELRRMMAEAEWDFKVAEFNFLYQQYTALGLISDEVAARLKIILEALNDPANRPDFSRPPPPPAYGGGDYNNQQDEALQAQRELIAALNDLADLQRELWASDLSPLNAEQQTQFLAGQLQDAFNQAQASGNAEDVRAFQDLVRQYLSSYQDAYGSTGGYTEEFLRINSLINSLLAMGNIGGVVPGPGMLGGNAGTGSTGWRPTPGATGTVLPFERTGGPGSPLVVESPALTAIASLAAETNRRLAALETRMGGLHGAVEAGNERLASKLFTGGRNDLPTMSGRPRIQRRGA